MNIANTTEIILRNNDLETISHYMYMIIYPFIFLVGLVGNALSSLLFSITNLNRTTCAVYFLLLAIFDSLALIGGLHHCLTIGYYLPVPNATYCRVRNFLLYTSMDMASWMIVAISVDRFLKVKFPIRAHVYSTRKLTIIISCVIFVLLAIKNSHLASVFIGDFSVDAADNCDANPDYPIYVAFFRKIWPWIDLVIFAALPFLIVSICNGFIIYEQYKRRVKLRKRNLDRTFITLLLVSSISMIICNLPITILAIIYPYISSSYDNNDIYDGVAFAFDILRLPSYGALALNFYFYYYTSDIFQQQVALLFKRLLRIQSTSDDTELIESIPTDQNPFAYRPYSIGESDDYRPARSTSVRDGSFILNYYRQ